ncbi:MAG: exonuclease SbcCD subunit D C-terminal domain-containing protein, partial [Erysipelotrichaceae bacterium]|nr:exonuclease SbcCD subunit D C-terminal domain-containing protein [Erysipelotrichaceae bacterium]
QNIESYTDALKTVIDSLQMDKTQRNVLVTHQFVTGSVRSESEEISVGGTDNVDVSVFHSFDYVALGHLHRAQKCGSEFVRYSGSPLKYSFSEAKDDKTIPLIDIYEKGKMKISYLPLVPLRNLVELKGSYEELTLKSFYEGTSYPQDYVHITLTDEQDIPDVLTKLRVIYKNIMKLDYDNHRTRHHAEITGAFEETEKSPFDHFSDFYELQNGQKMNEDQISMMKKLMEEIWGDDQ